LVYLNNESKLFANNQLDNKQKDFIDFVLELSNPSFGLYSWYKTTGFESTRQSRYRDFIIII